MSADFAYGFGITGADEVARHLASVAGQLDRLSTKQTQNAAAGRQMARSGQEATRSFQGLVGQGQQLTQKIQGTTAAVQSLVGQLGGSNRSAGLISSVAGNVAQFSALGSMLGPAGTVIGGIVGLTTAVAAFIVQENDAAEATREHNTALRDQATAALAARDALREARDLESAGSSGALAPTMLASASDEDLRRRAEEMRARARELDAAEVASRPTGERSGADTAIAQRLRREREERRTAAEAELATTRASITALENETERRLAVAAAAGTEANAIAAAGTEREREARSQRELEEEWQEAVRDRTAYEEAQRQRAIAGAAERAEAMEASWAREAAAIAEVTAREEELRNIHIEEAAKAAEEAARAEAEALAEATKGYEDLVQKMQEVADLNEELRHTADNLSHAFGTGLVSSLSEVADAWREANRAASAAGTGMLSTGQLLERSLVAVGNNIADTIGNTMTGAFEKALGAWLDGTKTFVEAAEDMVKGVLKALVIESIVQAVTETARGIADVASYQYATGAQHFAAAAAWAAVGVAAGAVGAGIGAFGGGGGGGAQSAPTSRELAGQQEQSRGGDSYEINIFPGGFTTRDEVTGGMFDALNYGARNGRSLDSRVVRR